MPVRHFARQPIVDTRGTVLGYELLHRADAATDIARVIDGVAATRSVLSALAASDRNGRPGPRSFVNLPRPLLLDGTMLRLDPKRVAIEVLEDVVSDGAVLAALAELRTCGFTVALDDFRPDPRRMPLVSHADIVKLDVQDLAGRDLAAMVTDLHHHGVLVLAEKVETRAELDRCTEAGFDLFQGFAVGVPSTVSVDVPGRQLLRRPRLLGIGELTDPLTP